ncbi:MAG: DUF4249 domain-containing protein [Bacteroidales bacterium]
MKRTSTLTETRSSLWILLCVYLMWSGCTQYVDDVLLPHAPPELMIHCFIYPGMDTVELQLLKTHPVFAKEINTEQLIVDDAEVFLETREGEMHAFSFCIRRLKYVLPCSQVVIHEGETYGIHVRHKAFPLAYAYTTVPFVHSDFEVSRLDSTLRSYNKSYYVDTYIHDTPGMANYYVLYGYLVGFRDGSTEEGNDAENDFSLRIFPFDEYISDERLDGLAIPKSGTTHMALRDMPKKLHFQLFSIDKHFYAYRQSILDLDNLEIDPFATPVKLYSNFSSGYGVFAAYSIFVHEVGLVYEH